MLFWILCCTKIIVQSRKTLCFLGLKFLCTDLLLPTSSSPVPGSEGQDCARELSRSWLGSAPWRWERFWARPCSASYTLTRALPLSGSSRPPAAGKGQVLSMAGGSCVHGAGAASRAPHPAGGLRKEPSASAPGGSASRHPPCPRPDLRSPSPLRVRFHNRPAPVYSGSVSPWKINCVCVFSSPLVLLQGRERGRDSARCYRVGWLGKQHPRSSSSNPTFN